MKSRLAIFTKGHLSFGLNCILIALSFYSFSCAALPELPPQYRFSSANTFNVPFPYFSYLKDSRRSISIDDLRKDPETFKFTPFARPIPGLGFTSYPYWVKFEAVNPYPEAISAYLEFADANIESLVFYHIRPDTIVACTTGVQYPFSHRGVNDRNFIFNCNFPPQSTSIIYLYCSAIAPLEFPLSLNDEPTFLRKQRDDHFVLGIIYGILIFFGVTALYLSILNGDKSYRYFALTLLTFCIHLGVLDGFAYMYFWPNSPKVQQFASQLCYAASSIWITMFAATFLKTSRLQQMIGHVLVALWGAVILLFYTLFPKFAGIAIIIMALFSISYVCIIGIINFRSYELPVRLYLSAWFLFFAMIILRITINTFGIPISPSGMATIQNGYRLHIGIVIIVLLTSWAMGYRVRRIELERNSSRLETETLKRKTLELELSTMQTRVQPHFLFNALNTIANMVFTDAQRAEKSLIELSEFYRTTLHYSIRKVSRLEEEIQLIRRYLTLEKMRFNERIDFSFSIDDHTLDVQLPAMSLQILVENSLKHGILPKIEGGAISIESSMVDGKCRIIVDDTGVGWQNKKSNSGTGLNGLRARLDFMFSKTYSLDISDKATAMGGESTGVRILLTIPAVRQTSYAS